MKRRGIVIAPPVMANRIDGGVIGLTIQSAAALDPLLRPYTMYWDVIDFPQNGIFGFGTSPDAQLLIDEGVLIQSPPMLPATLNSSNIAEFFQRRQLNAFLQHEASEPGTWAMGRTVSVPDLAPDPIAPIGRSLLVELYDALPVPSYDTPLADVLSFKLKRNAELLALRVRLDELFQEVITSDDLHHARVNAISKIDEALMDLSKASRESFLKRALSSLKIEINGRNLAHGAVGGAYVGQQLALNPAIGAAFGAAASAIKLDLQYRRSPHLSAKTAAYAYVYEANQKFGIK